MSLTIDMVDCPCVLVRDEDGNIDAENAGCVEEVCFWPSFHKDLCEIKSKGTYQTVNVGQLVEEPVRAGGRTRADSVRYRF